MSYLKRTMLLLSLLAVVLVAAGCQMVHVQDDKGKPISWAEVSTSTNRSGASNFPVKTDLFGNAMIGISQEEAGTREWLIISKGGYHTKRIIRPTEGAVDVTLLKTSTLPPVVNPADAKKKD
jgi:hypothetical protein